VLASSGAPHALHRRAIEQIAARYVNQTVLLRTDLRGGSPGPQGMQAPMLDAKGWHFSSGAAVLASGSHAEVTGVFNYADRGLFLEITRAAESDSEPLVDRPRVRVRLMTDAPSTDPGAQAAQAASLIEQLLSLSQP
jgi:hypothetical protein